MSRRIFIRYFVGCLLWLVALCVYAEHPIAKIDNLDQRFDLNPYVETIEDAHHEYTLEDIQTGKYDQLWQRNTQRYFIGKNYKSKYWFRFTLNWQGQQTADSRQQTADSRQQTADSRQQSVVYIDSQPQLLFRVGMLLPNAQGTSTLVTTGSLEPYNARDIAAPQYGFKLALTAGRPQTIFGWVDNAETALPPLLPIYLLSKSEFDQSQNQFNLIRVAFYSVMAALWFYNLCLFVTLREPTYGLYVLFLAGAVVTCASADGSGHQWVWAKSAIRFLPVSAAISLSTVVIYLTFVVRALNGVIFSPKIKTVYRMHFGLGCVCLVAELFADFSTATAIAQIYAAITFQLALFLIIIALRKKHPMAGYLLIAEINTIIGGSCYMLMIQGIVAIIPITLWGIHWGFAGEALLLSLALAARTRLAQQEAIQHLKNYETLYQDSHEGRFHYSLTEDNAKCNHAMATLCGYDSVEAFIADKRIRQLSDNETNKRLGELLSANGKVTDFEAQIIHQHTQHAVWVSVNMRQVKDDAGNHTHIDGTMIDITERKLAQLTAIDNLKKYEQLYESSTEGLFRFNFETESLTCNDALAKLFGHSSKDELMNNNTGLVNSRAAELWSKSEMIDPLFANGFINNFETSILSDATGQEVWVSINMKLINNELGKPIAIEGSISNISDKKLKELAQREIFNTQKELLKANQQAFENLSRSDELKNEFLATMSHELRTPMNGISGYLELLKSLECGGDVLTLVNSLEHCSSDMLRLIDRILDFTQLLAGNLSSESALLDFTQLLAELDSGYRKRCDAKSLSFKFEKEDTVPAKVWGDKKKLFAIISDLLDNAVKYTRTGGIEVIIKALPTKSESGNPYDVMNSVLVSVRDTGIGIAVSDRPKVFKAFSQIDGAFNRKQGGLGLGLAMCHEYIKLMNGTLTLLSEIGNGSKFDFIVDLKIIPKLAAPIATVQKNPEPHTFSKSANANILIVEDNPTNQLVLKGILKKLGHNTSVAKNGIQALEILQNAEFDLILMDCQMPEMDGFEATREIRQGDGRHKAIPIIAVTANVMEGDQQRCLDAGMNDYMKKPIKKELLMEKISQWYFGS